MFLSLLLLAAHPQEVVVRTSEPRPANPWLEMVSARCGDQQLELQRPIHPRESDAALRINGRAAEGDVRALEQELTEPRAAYRFSVGCIPESETMQLRWVRGLADGRGDVSYRVGSAFFRDGRLIDTRSEDADAEAFWYR